MRRSIVQLQEVAQRWRISVVALLGAYLALMARAVARRSAHPLRALRLRLSSRRAALQKHQATLRYALNDLLAAFAASLTSANQPSHDMQRPWLTPMPTQLPHVPASPPSAQTPHLEDHRFRQRLERRVLTTTPDFTAGVMARLATSISTTETPTLTPLATLSTTPFTMQPVEPSPSRRPLRALPWRTLLAQVSVVGFIYAISAGIMLGTSIAIAVIEPNMVLTAFVSWINSVVGLMTWFGNLTHLLIGSIGLLGIAYLLMLALLASLAVVALGAPRLVTTLWREA